MSQPIETPADFKEMYWQLVHGRRRSPLLSRSARLAIFRAALSLPPSLTISLYLVSRTEHQLMAIPVGIGMVAISSLIFLFYVEGPFAASFTLINHGAI